MKRTVRIYKYKCDECGWEAFRGEIIPADLCSRCGSTKPPAVSTEDREFEINLDVEKSAEYVKRLLAGEAPEDIDPIEFKAPANVARIIGGSFGVCVNPTEIDDPITLKCLGKPVIY
jgi:hypothetical protein